MSRMNRYLNKAQLYQQVDEIRRQLRLPVPLNPLSLARELGIEILYREFDSSRLCGALIRSKYHSAIVLNQNHLPTSQKFTCAHELGHYFLHSDIAQFLCDGDLSPIEWQANAAAAELLMPYRIFLAQIKNIYSRQDSTVDDAVRQMAFYFRVTPLLIRQRVNSLSYEIYQVTHGVPIDQVEILSENKRRLRGLPAGPSGKQLFPPKSIDIWMDDD